MHKKFTNRFRLRFAGENETGGSGGEQLTAAPPANAAGDPAFPADTPLAEMTVEQREAYWKDKARKHERNAKPKDYDDILADAQKWRQKQDENKSPDDRALEQVREEAKREAVGTLLHDAVRAQLQALRPKLTVEELDEFLEDVKLDNYIGDDGRLNTDRVTRLAGKLTGAQEEGGVTPPEPDPAPGASALGDVLRRTTQPPKGNTGSVDDYRAREAQRYASK